jgi:hypothetical protein
MFDFAETTKDMTAKEILNYYRNLYYAEPQVTERGIVANAINDVLADVVPRSEVDMIHHLLKDAWKRIEELDNLCGELQKAKDEVAREIFEEIDRAHEDCIVVLGDMGYLQPQKFVQKFAELKKKYTEGEK